MRAHDASAITAFGQEDRVGVGVPLVEEEDLSFAAAVPEALGAEEDGEIGKEDLTNLLVETAVEILTDPAEK